MSGYTMSVICAASYEETLARVRAALAEAGFGVITEIDMRATLAAKLGVEIAPQMILGACNPGFAHRAIAAEPSVAALLPCNVVVRAADDGRTVVEAFDPAAMARLGGDPALAPLIEDVRRQLRAALDAAADQEAN